MHQSNLSISELQELDDLDNVNLSFSGLTPTKPENIPSLDMSQVYDESNPLDQEDVENTEKSVKKYLPARFKYNSLDMTSTQKMLQLKKQRLAKIEFKVNERIEKDKRIRKERCTSFNKLTLTKPFNIENLADSLNIEKSTKFQEDIFEVKIRNRVKESWKILKKAKKMNSVFSKSIIHATLCENCRIVEAHLDVCSNDLERLRKVNTVDQCFRSALHYAAALGNEDLAGILLQMGADPKLKDYKSRSPLHYAAFSNSRKIVDVLLRGYRKHAKTVESMQTIKNVHTVARVLKFKKPVLFDQPSKVKLFAVQNSSSVEIDPKQFNEYIEDLLEKMNKKPEKKHFEGNSEKFIDWTDEEGRTSLHLAVLNEKPTIVQALLEAGSKIDIEDIYNKRPLELSRSKFITTLLVYRLKENLKRKKDKKLSDTIDNRDLLVLSEEDISKCMKNDSQSTYLMNAVKSNNVETVKILLNKKVSVTAVNTQGWNALMFAIQGNNLALVKIMLEGSEAEANRWKFGIKSWVEDAWKALDSVTKEGWSAVHIAAVFSSVEMIMYLIDVFRMRKVAVDDKECPEVFRKFEFCSLDKIIDLPCRKKMTPFLLAVRYNRLEIIKILVASGCDTYVRNGKLQNALHISAAKGYAEVLEYLIRQDADRNILRSQLDIQKRCPKDLDVFNKLDPYFLHIWDHCRMGETEKVKELLDLKTYTINEQTTSKKNTPLHLAIEFKQLKTIKLLISLGADHKILNAQGKSPLELVFSSNDSEFIKSVCSLIAPSAPYPDPKPFQDPRTEKILNKTLPKIMKKPGFDKKDVSRYWEKINKKLIEKKVSINFMFDMMDQSRKGSLNISEFKNMLVWLGLTFNSEICYKLFKNADENMNDLLDYHETIKQLHRVMSKPVGWSVSNSMPKLKLNRTLNN